MTEKFQGIVIDVTRHNDRNDIVTLFTRSRGRVSFISPAGAGKAARLRQARLMPLSVIEGDVNFRANVELQRLGQFSPSIVWTDIYFHPVKRMVAIFLSEFLNRLLRASMPDPTMWDFIVESLRLFDGMKKDVADFHITFLASLLPFAGIQPDASAYREGMVFDFQEGRFRTFAPLHRDYLLPDAARIAALICRVNFSNMHALRLNGTLRYQILDGLLHYYGIHYPGTSNLKSLSVLHDLVN